MKMPNVNFDVIQCGGGLDQVTPVLALKPGTVRQASNFECSIYGGYSRIAGYERFDGRPSPSAALGTVVYIATMAVVPTVGQTLTGATSGATGVICAVENGYVVVTKHAGVAFAVGETARVGATTIGTVTVSTGPISSKENAIHAAAAADIYRADIQKVPGSGPVRGVFIYNDLVYAFRDNVGGTAVDLYKSSAAGWVNVPYLYEVSFTAGTAIPADGATLTQGGVTSTIKRTCTQSGAWTGSAAGRFVITAPAGGNFAAGAATATGGTTINLSGVQTAITFATGGKFETVNANFSGSLSTFRTYGCDGANRAWEFDGTTLAPISTGAATDKPKHIAVHKNMLFLSFSTSALFSAPGEPFNYTTVSGAGEIAIGDTVTGMIVMPGNQTTAALAVFGLSNTFILYGTAAANFNLVPFNTGTGAAHYSAQNMAQTLAMDDRGVISLQSSLNYGNFDSATLTHNIRPFMEQHRAALSCSMLNRTKSQYRLFFSDNYGLYITIANGQMIGSMPVYFPVAVFCAVEDKLSSGAEASYFGGTDGYVYQMEMGNSFDGANIYSFINLNYNASGGPRILKRYTRAAIEIRGTGYAGFNFGYKLGYESDLISQPNNVAHDSNFSVPYWDSLTWDNFIWDGRDMMPSECDMDGTAENASIVITGDANYHAPYTINSIILQYMQRRALR